MVREQPTFSVGVAISYKRPLKGFERAIEEVVSKLPEMTLGDTKTPGSAQWFAERVRKYARYYAPRRKTKDVPKYREPAGTLRDRISWSIVGKPKAAIHGKASSDIVISIYSSAKAVDHFITPGHKGFPYAHAQEFGTKRKVAKNRRSGGLKAGQITSGVGGRNVSDLPFMRFEVEPGKWVTVREARGTTAQKYMARAVATAWMDLEGATRKNIDRHITFLRKHIWGRTRKTEYTRHQIRDDLKKMKIAEWKEL